MEETKKLYFHVQGMTCSSCAEILHNIIKNTNINGIKKVNISAISNLAIITLENNVQDLKDTIKKIIAAAKKVDFTLEQNKSEKFIINKKTTSNIIWLEALVNLSIGIPLLILNLVGILPVVTSMIGQLIWGLIGIATLIMMAITGKNIYQDAIIKLKQKKLNMNTLITLGTFTAFIASCIAILFPHLYINHAIHFAGVMIILGIVKLGTAIKTYAENSTRDKICSIQENFYNLLPENVMIKFKNDHQNEFKKLDFNLIKEGHILKISPGEKIPVDGIIISENKTEIQQQTITGEINPVIKKINDEVFAGTINITHPIQIKATTDAKNSSLYKLLKELIDSSVVTTPQSIKINKIANYFVPIIIIIAIITFGAWIIFSSLGFGTAITSMTAILLCACPCALGLAAPISMLIAYFRAFENGCLIKNLNAVEEICKSDTLILDKTGTITQVEANIKNIISYNDNYGPAELLSLAAAIEQHSHHPIARAIVKNYLQKQKKFKYICTDFIPEINGVKGKINDENILIGNINFIQKNVTNIPNKAIEKAQLHAKTGRTPLFISKNTTFLGMICLENSLREDLKQYIPYLKSKFNNIIICSGDNTLTTQYVANKLKIKDFHANCTPDKKQQLVKQLHKEGHHTTMLGDGLNDTKALKQADVSVAIDSWTYAAANSDVSLRGKITDFVKFIEISKKTNSNINQNLLWTFIYNSVAILLSAGLLMPFFNILIPPVIASIGMAFSSLIVVLNASRLFLKLNNPLKDYKAQKSKTSNKLIPKIQFSFGKKTLLSSIYLLSLGLLAYGFIECNAHMGLHRLFIMLTTPFVTHCMCCLIFTLATILLISAMTYHFILYKQTAKHALSYTQHKIEAPKKDNEFSKTTFIRSSTSGIMPDSDPKNRPHNHESLHNKGKKTRRNI